MDFGDTIFLDLITNSEDLGNADFPNLAWPN